MSNCHARWLYRDDWAPLDWGPVHHYCKLESGHEGPHRCKFCRVEWVTP